MKILYIGSFDNENKSTNNAQFRALKRLGHDVMQYNYPVIDRTVGRDMCDENLIKTVRSENFDFVLISKGSMDNWVVIEMLKTTLVGLWYMDPLVPSSFNEQVQERCKIVNFVCCDKLNVLEKCLLLNKNSYHVCEGFDRDVDSPLECDKEVDVSMIGEPYGYRLPFLQQANYPVAIVQGAYGRNHATVVSKTKINLNFVTEQGASDRVYKIMAAGGFLLTNDWIGRSEMFKDGEHLVIFDDPMDFRKKIEFYLKNDDLRNKIAKSGFNAVQEYNRDAWAKTVVEIYHQIKSKREVNG